MNKFTLTLLLALGLWLLPANTTHANDVRVHISVGNDYPGPYSNYWAYPRYRTYYSPSWYYHHRPHSYDGGAHHYRHR